MAFEVNRARRHERATRVIEESGGQVLFERRFLAVEYVPQDKALGYFLSRPYMVELHTCNDPELAAELPKLDGLRLVAIRGGNQKNDGLLQHLDECNGLRSLRLRGINAADDDSVEILKRMTHLKIIRLWGSTISDKALEELKDSLPKCEIKMRPPAVNIPDVYPDWNSRDGVRAWNNNSET